MDGTFTIDPKIREFIPALTSEERAQLEANIIADGCRDALVVWDEAGILLDGHNRYDICTSLGRTYKVERKSFPDRTSALIWVALNQFGRRNLNLFQRSELALTLEWLFQKKAKENQGTRTDICQNSDKCPIEPVDTKKALAKLASVSHDTIAKVKVIAEKADDKTKEQLRRGEVSINAVHKKLKAEDKAAKRRSVITEPCDPRVITDLSQVFGEKFACVYADPPWMYDNQGTRASTDKHYDTMPVSDICALPVAELVADEALLFLWTTNAFLFESLRVIDAWGFEFKSSMVWVKSQMGIGNYVRNAHEFLLIANRGGLLTQDAGKSQISWISADRTAHSAKPGEFRRVVEKLSRTPRLEMFGRESADGWTVFGNQVQTGMFG